MVKYAISIDKLYEWVCVGTRGYPIRGGMIYNTKTDFNHNRRGILGDFELTA